MALLLAPIAGRLADRIGERPLVMLGLGLEATGLLLIGALITDTSGYRIPVGPLFIAGAGIAIAFPTVTTAVMRSVGPDETAVVRHQQHLPPGRRCVWRRDRHRDLRRPRQLRHSQRIRRRTQPRLHHPRRPLRNRGARGSPAPAGALGRQTQNSAHGDSPSTSTRSVTRPSATEPDRQSAQPSTSDRYWRCRMPVQRPSCTRVRLSDHTELVGERGDLAAPRRAGVAHDGEDAYDRGPCRSSGRPGWFRRARMAPRCTTGLPAATSPPYGRTT